MELYYFTNYTSNRWVLSKIYKEAKQINIKKSQITHKIMENVEDSQNKFKWPQKVYHS